MRKSFAVAACGLSLATVVAASVADAAPSTGGFKATISPSKNVKPGTTIVAKGTHGLKSQKYYCSQILIQKGSTTAFVANTASITQVTSSSTGKVTCKQKFEPFSGTYAGKKISCPTTKANKKAHWSCALGVADVASSGVRSGATLFFTAKK